MSESNVVTKVVQGLLAVTIETAIVLIFQLGHSI